MATWHGYHIHDADHPVRPWWRRDAPIWRRTDGAEVTAPADPDLALPDLAAADAADPLPTPAALPSQVWASTIGGDERLCMVTEAYGSQVLMSRCITLDSWPPPDSVLVHGPFSPWAPES